MARYAVEEHTLCDGWVNNWAIEQEDGTRIVDTYETPEEAQTALDDFIADLTGAFKAGDIMEAPDPAEYRIVEIRDINAAAPDADFTRFDGFEVAGVVEITEEREKNGVKYLARYCEQVDEADDGKAHFWTVYGHYDPTDWESGVTGANVGLDAVTDCDTRLEAERLAALFEIIRKQQSSAKSMLTALENLTQYFCEWGKDYPDDAQRFDEAENAINQYKGAVK